jgi:hypothetical protein
MSLGIPCSSKKILNCVSSISNMFTQEERYERENTRLK